MKALVLSLMLATTLATTTAFAADDAAKSAPTPKVKYKAAKDMSFEDLLIQGELKRPEISVITGNAQQGTDGLLRLREDFLDRIAADFGEKTVEKK